MGKVSGYKVLLAVVLVVAVGIALWFAAPVRNTADVYNDEGFAQNRKGEFDKAVKESDLSLQLDPSDIDAKQFRKRLLQLKRLE